ncbi:DUF7691 family protein [Polyangium jinanense]|uniref:DUF7691 domain-containing protein n=1 Tax=Polyangium jinanense TaxID=2829994 RepID=A0A9X3XHQ9_9BACT|nr:hypothetical protein [Polyangium jinanense]MDC3962741.1 hypothetical protein [Polyangium jinanense]MDC3989590.1 hypothetical protein [Polyangium jinanense]
MGSNTTAVAVDIDRVKAAWGSNDASLRARVLSARYSKYLATIDDPSTGALDEILAGALGDCRPSQYGYAVVALMHTLGTLLQHEVRSMEAIFGIDDVDSPDLNYPDETWPVPIPNTPEYPLVTIIPRDRLAALAAKIPAAHDGKGGEFIEALTGWVAKTIELGVDLVIFDY